MESKSRENLHQTIITTYGLVHNAYSGAIQSEIVLNDLFL